MLDVILPSYDKMMIEDPAKPGTQVLKYPKTPEGQAWRKNSRMLAEIMRIIQSGGTRLKVEEWAIKVENS